MSSRINLQNRKKCDHSTVFNAYQTLYKRLDRLWQRFDERYVELNIDESSNMLKVTGDVIALEQKGTISPAESWLVQMLAAKNIFNEQEFKSQQPPVETYRNKDVLVIKASADNQENIEYTRRKHEIFNFISSMDIYPEGLSKEQYISKCLNELKLEIRRKYQPTVM